MATPFSDDDDEEWDDPDFADEEAGDDDESGDETDDTVPCPYCRKPIHEDAQRCPYCESYISREDAPLGPFPWWIIVGVILCSLVILGWIFGG